ncbi:hypothetical protein LTR50_000713 [Elasticomyces elasticus]|nr:hypothetical protein LTR50_000713 [Elasticomyces elasticus]
MFREVLSGLPQDPLFEANLTKIGIEVTPTGQFVRIGEPDEFFKFRSDQKTQDFQAVSHVNEVRRETFHECVRNEVTKRLSDQNIASLYLPQLTTEQPSEAHIPILCTAPEILRHKHNVIVVVGESVQDLAIWAYRIVSRTGGMDEGSAVGLAKKLQAWQDVKSENEFLGTDELMIKAGNVTKAEAYRSAGSDKNIRSQPFDGTTTQNIKSATTEDDEENAAKTSNNPSDNDTPGLIILNPGQPLYSPALNKAMSIITWQTRPRPSAGSGWIQIDEEHNKVNGHRSPREHIASVMETVVCNAEIVHPDSNLFFVGIGDGGDVLLEWLDKHFSARLLGSTKSHIGNRLDAIVLIDSLHKPASITDPALKTFLAVRGRSYVLSTEKQGKDLKMPILPAPMRPTFSYYKDKDVEAIVQAMGGMHATSGTEEEKSNLATRIDSMSATPGAEGVERSVYEDDSVSCPTYASGEEETTELIWPKVMDDVLSWFKRFM